MSGFQLTEEVLEDYVVKGIERWRKGELFMGHGISENDVILKAGEKLPDKSDKAHPFNRFLESVAADFAQELGMDKRERKLVLRKLQACKTNWQQIVLKNNESTKSPMNTTTDAPAPAGSNQIENKNKDTTKTKKKAAPPLKKPPPPVDPPLMRREAHKALLEDKRKGFEKARELILEEVPPSVKERFGEICFSKWGKQVLPCLVLSPYSVAPGGVRDMWLDMFDKVRQADRLDNMTNLVYWYGSHNDPANAYSFLPTKVLTTYENGVKKKFDQVSPMLQKKLEQGKLSATQRLLVEGLEEMKADLNKKPEERSGKIGMDFIEAYEISTDDDEHDEDELEDEDVFEESPVGTNTVKKEIPDDVGNIEGKAKLPKKRKKDEELSSIESEAATPSLKKRKKSKVKTKKAKSIKTEVNPTSSVEAGDVPLKPIKSTDSSPVATNQDEVDNFGDADISSHDEPDEDYEHAMAESASDDDKDDTEYLGSTAISKPGKAKREGTGKKSQKDLPKKKDSKSKVKIEKASKEKKVPSEEKRRKDAQKAFRACEKAYAPLIRRWRQAIDERDEETIVEVYKELIPEVENFHVSFITDYDISPLMKQSKAIVDNSDRKVLMGALKTHYLENRKSVPAGFKPIKMKEIEVPAETSLDIALPREKEEELPEVKIKTESQESLVSSGVSQDVAMPPAMERVGSLEKMSIPPEPEAPRPVVKVERKKKFSLGNLMRPTSDPPKGATSTPTVAKVATPTPVQPKQEVLPEWISSSSDQEAPKDDTRAFALEFLCQAVPFIPQTQQQVNHNGIARALEASIHEWATSHKKSNWVDAYWTKIDDIVAAISGNEGAGTIATLIAEGKFKSPVDVVQLSDDDIMNSFLGKSMAA